MVVFMIMDQREKGKRRKMKGEQERQQEVAREREGVCHFDSQPECPCSLLKALSEYH